MKHEVIEKRKNELSELAAASVTGKLSPAVQNRLTYLSRLIELVDLVNERIYITTSDQYIVVTNHTPHQYRCPVSAARIAGVLDEIDYLPSKDCLAEAITLANPIIDSIGYRPDPDGDESHLLIDLPDRLAGRKVADNDLINTLIESVAGGCQDKIDHLTHLICYKLSNPTAHNMPALLLQDRGSTGKGLLFDIMLSTAVGRKWHSQVPNIEALTGRFNTEIAGKTIVYVPELDDTSHRAADALKALIMSDSLRLERKGVDSIKIDNIGWFVFSGNKVGNLKLDGTASDRRYSVFTDEFGRTLEDRMIEKYGINRIPELVELLRDPDVVLGWVNYQIHQNPHYATDLPVAYHGTEYHQTVKAARNQYELFADYLIDQILAGEVIPDRKGVIGLKMLKNQYLKYIDSSKPADWFRAKRWVIEALNKHKAFVASSSPRRHDDITFRGVLLLVSLAELREQYGESSTGLTDDTQPQVIDLKTKKLNLKDRYSPLRTAGDEFDFDLGQGGES